jgi:hypothetical protein
MSAISTVQRLMALGLSRKQLAAVIEILAENEQADAERRRVDDERKRKDDERKERERERARIRREKAADNPRTGTGQSADANTDNPPTGSPDKETSPAPPKENNPSSSLRSANKKKETDARASRIPDGFQPDLSEAIRLGLSPADAEREAANFIDYWHQANGRTAVKRDWRAAWRVWCRKAVQDRGNQPRANGQHRSGPDAMYRAAADLMDDLSDKPREIENGQFKLVSK